MENNNAPPSPGNASPAVPEVEGLVESLRANARADVDGGSLYLEAANIIAAQAEELRKYKAWLEAEESANARLHKELAEKPK